jgi:hypothetical protein
MMNEYLQVFAATEVTRLFCLKHKMSDVDDVKANEASADKLPAASCTEGKASLIPSTLG